MGVLQAHAINENELKKFKISHCDVLSVAEYFHPSLDEKPLFAFEHAHDEYEFVIPTETMPLIKYDKASYIGEVGYCYPINPWVNHGTEFDLDACSVISITADKKWVDSLKKELGYGNQFFYTHFILKRDLLDKIRMFQKECQKENPNQIIINDLATAIVKSIITESLSLGYDNRKPEKVYAKNIRKVLRFMYENYKNPALTISQLAKLSGYSLSYFSRSFRAYMNDSPIVHLNKLRISEAKRLFKNKELTLEQIALQAGYRILSTFTEAFKSLNGCKPKKYRDMYF